MINQLPNFIKKTLGKKPKIKIASAISFSVVTSSTILFFNQKVILSEDYHYRQNEPKKITGTKNPKKIEIPYQNNIEENLSADNIDCKPKTCSDPPCTTKAEEILNFKNIDTSEWKTFSNNWFGFYLKYPADWNEPEAVNPNNQNNDLFEKKYVFTKKEIDNESKIIGFEIKIYNKKKISSLMETQEFIKNDPNYEPKICNDYTKKINLNGNNAYETEVRLNDPCYQEKFFFTYDRPEYYYNIVPIFKNKNQKEEITKNKAVKSFPELGAIAKNFNLKKIIRPTPKPRAPIPHGAKKVNGKYVCGKKNDKPSKSDKNPPGHMDMQCCLDPDEVPNPWCTY